MKQIIKDIIGSDDYIFHDSLQNKLDLLCKSGKQFRIEEYFNWKLTAYVIDGKLFMFNTKETEDSDKIVGEILQFKDFNELHSYATQISLYLTEEELKNVFADIKEEYTKQNKSVKDNK